MTFLTKKNIFVTQNDLQLPSRLEQQTNKIYYMFILDKFNVNSSSLNTYHCIST